MNEAHVSEDRLIDLLGGLLDQAAEGETLAHLKTCEMCERHFRMLVSERETLRTKPAPAVQGGHIVLPEYSTPDNVIQLRRRRRVRWISASAVAAAAVLAFVIPYILRPATSGALKYWMPTSEETPVETPAGTEIESLQDALRAYENRDERAVEMLESAPVPEGDMATDSIRRLYQASALVNEGRGARALEVLNTFNANTLPEPWRARAGWVRYLALKQVGGLDAAQAMLDQLADTMGDVGEMAREERERLAGD